MTKQTKQNTWTLRWRMMVRPTPLPGVWQMKEGGYFVRARVADPATGRLKEIKKVLPQADDVSALKWLRDETARVRAGIVSAQSPKPRFSEFAADLFELKKTTGDLKSAKGRERWKHTLVHLVEGTTGPKSGKFVSGFGDYFVDKLHVAHVETWKAKVAELINGGDYKPSTVNGWMSILTVIVKAAKRKYGLPHLATEDVRFFDESDHATYTEEEPNALRPEEVTAFLEGMRDLYPQHYAMTYLGFVTGLRPSSLRPLRRRGPNADVLWDQNRILIRRSQTLGDEVMNRTKQKTRYAIDLPEEVMAVLRWHVGNQLTTPAQDDSDLLFPSVVGSFRSPCVLNKPFADVADALELGKKFSQRGLRRSFQDLTRAAKVESLVTRSISGHATERMQDRYSTIDGSEQRAAIGKVLHLVTGGAHGGAQRA